jgi:hypothetical protein
MPRSFCFGGAHEPPLAEIAAGHLVACHFPENLEQAWGLARPPELRRRERAQQIVRAAVVLVRAVLKFL